MASMDTDIEDVAQDERDNLQEAGAALALLGQGEVWTEKVNAQGSNSADGEAAAKARRVLQARATRTPPEERGAAAGTAQATGGNIEQMFATLRREMKNDLAAFQSHTDAKLESVQQIVQAAIEPMQRQQYEMQGRIQAHEDAINDVRQQILDLRLAQKGSEEKVEKVQRELTMVDEKAPPPPPPDAGWDRAVDRTVAKATCKAEVSLDEVRKVVNDILEEVNVATTAVEVEAPLRAQTSTKWTIRFKGEQRRAARQADAFLGALRTGAGWRDIVVGTPSGGQERLYIGVDKSPQTVRREIHTKRVRDMMARMYPQADLFPSRRDGIVSSRYKPLVKVEVYLEETVLKFNEELLGALGMDKADIQRKWAQEAATASSSASVQWRS